jgi:S1-C subfamily serine protease
VNRAREILSNPFAAALTGGLVVALAGVAAISAGWVKSSEGADETSLQEPSLARPVSDKGDNAVGEIYKRTNDGVVFVQADSGASGSGFVIDEDGSILTNAHVVAGADAIRVTIGDSESSVKAEVVGEDTSTDVALLDVDADADSLSPLQMGRAEGLEVGDPVVAIGNPFGLDRTVTSGIVSALQREIQAPNGFSISNVIQTDAAINPGNSGGPLLDGSGRVIGINSQIASSSGGNDGVGFAVPIETAIKVAGDLLADGEVEHAYLGITGADLTPQIANALDLDVDEGAMVTDAVQGGPADEAGIRGATREATIQGQPFPADGDVIVAVDGEAVAEMADVIAAIDSRQVGETLTLTIVRDGEQRDIDVKLGNRPEQIEDAAVPTLP